jgi:predicted acetyltransferase
MMARQLDDCLAWNEPIALLTASESVIYGRFGYGWGTSVAGVEVSCRHGAFAAPPSVGGRMRRVDTETALKVAPALHERVRRQTIGDVSMVPPHWEFLAADMEHRRDGASAFFFAVHESELGEPDGFVAYRYKEHWVHGNPEGTVVVHDLFAATPEVEAAVFRYLLDLDLVARVRFWNRPVPDPLQWRLANPRRYETRSVNDHMWVRLVDVAAALPLRRYTTDGSVVLQVHDRFRPTNEGVYLLEGGPDGAICGHAPAGTEPDVELAVDSLGAAFLGGISFASLAASGRAVERRAGGLRRADAMFVTDVPPYCRSGF